MSQCKSVHLIISYCKNSKPNVLLEVLPTGKFYLRHCPSGSAGWGCDAVGWVQTYCVETSVTLAQIFFFLSQLIDHKEYLWGPRHGLRERGGIVEGITSEGVWATCKCRLLVTSRSAHGWSCLPSPLDCCCAHPAYSEVGHELQVHNRRLWTQSHLIAHS